MVLNILDAMYSIDIAEIYLVYRKQPGTHLPTVLSPKIMHADVRFF